MCDYYCMSISVLVLSVALSPSQLYILTLSLVQTQRQVAMFTRCTSDPVTSFISFTFDNLCLARMKGPPAKGLAQFTRTRKARVLDDDGDDDDWMPPKPKKLCTSSSRQGISFHRSQLISVRPTMDFIINATLYLAILLWFCAQYCKPVFA